MKLRLPYGRHRHQPCKSSSRPLMQQGRGWGGRVLLLTLISFFGQAREAEGGIRKCGEKEEKKEEKEGAAGPVLMAEGALNPSGALLSQRRKAQDGGPQGVKLELHPLLNR